MIPPPPAGELVDAFSTAAERFGIAVASVDPAAPVPACPGWDVFDLVVHLGNVHAWAATVVETGRSAADQNDRPALREPRAMSAWYAGKAEDLYEVLAAADPAAACWNFAHVGETAAFWPRRQTHETLMHLVDLDRAAGRMTELPADLATDGVAEAFEVFLPRMHARGHPTRVVAPTGFLALDTGRSWTLRPPLGPDAVVPDAGPPAVTDGIADDVEDAVRAPASVLWQLVWKRVGPDHPAVTCTGDQDRVRALLASRLTP